jgi:rhodanese-related sulfurtransferase
MKLLNNILMAVIIGASIFSCASNSIETSISMSEFKKLYSANPKIKVIDVRTLGEFNGPLGHITTATLMPLSNIQGSVDKLKTMGQEPVYVVCRSGNRSGKATSILLQNDINAINVLGGMKAWNQ